MKIVDHETDSLRIYASRILTVRHTRRTDSLHDDSTATNGFLQELLLLWHLILFCQARVVMSQMSTTTVMERYLWTQTNIVSI